MSRLAVLPLAAVAALAALAGCAPAARSPGQPSDVSSVARKCLFQGQIQSFRVAQNDRTVYVRGTGREIFQLEAAGYCRDLGNAMGLAFLPQGGLDRFCVGDWTQVVPSGATPPVTPCRVRVAKVLTEAEAAALPARDRP